MPNTKNFTNTFKDGEVTGSNPDADLDLYKLSDHNNDHHYFQEKIARALIEISKNNTSQWQIIFGGEVTDGGSGTVNIAKGSAIGTDASGNIKLIHIPALTGVSLPSGWNNTRQIWVVGKYDSKLDTVTGTRAHAETAENYHYTLLDSYVGESSSDDLFVDADPNISETVVCWGSFTMNGTTFADLSSGERTRLFFTDYWTNPAANTAPAGGDKLLLKDAGTGDTQQITLENLITGATELAATAANDDELAILDKSEASGSEWKKIQRTNLLNVLSITSGTISRANVSGGYTGMGADDTAPQITEGSEIATLSVTPVSASSYLIFLADFTVSPRTGGNPIAAALFKAGTNDAIQTWFNGTAGDYNARGFKVSTSMAIVASHGASALTYSIRASDIGGTAAFDVNTADGGAYYFSMTTTPFICIEVKI